MGTGRQIHAAIPAGAVPALRRGDVVGVAAPASPPPLRELDVALERLRGLGLRPRWHHDRGESHPYLGRSDAARAAELAELFLDPEVKAIFCACPGYGSLRLLPLLPWPEIARHPKIIMGYSDLTALLIAVRSCCGFRTLHGPTLLPGFLPGFTPQATWRALRRALFGGTGPARYRLPQAEVIVEGTATGPLIGGNLEMLTALMGTPWEPATAGTILFIEEVGEGEETLDQRLTQLRLSGMFEHVRGVIFGDMSGNELTPPCRVADVVASVLGDLGFPVLIGFPAGHGASNVPLALGAPYSLSTATRTVTELESGVERVAHRARRGDRAGAAGKRGERR